MVTFTEILQVEKQEGVAQGMAQGEARMLVEYVDAVWGADTGQRFRERLLALDHAAWPAMRDLLAASRAGRYPLDLLRAAARDKALLEQEVGPVVSPHPVRPRGSERNAGHA